MLECTKKVKINFLISDSAFLKDGNINFTGNVVGRSRNILFTCLFLFLAPNIYVTIVLWLKKHSAALQEPPSSPTTNGTLHRKLSDTDVVRYGSCPRKPNLTTPELVERFPCRTLSSVPSTLRLQYQSKLGNPIRIRVLEVAYAQPACSMALNRWSLKRAWYLTASGQDPGISPRHGKTMLSRSLF